jgi:predicted Zn-dependent protease
MRMQFVGFLARHRDKAAVEAELVSAIRAAPDFVTYDIALANIHARDGDFERAVKILRDAITRIPSTTAHAAAQIALARLMLARDDLAGARTIVDGMLKERPADDDFVALRGQLSLKDQEPAAAIPDFLSIATHQPANSVAYALLADAYLQNDQPGEAIAALRRVLSLSPANADILRRIAEIQSGLGDLAAAYRTTEDFVSRNPDSLDARALQARLAIRSKDWTSAETVLVNLREQPQSEQIAVELEAEFNEARNRYPEAARLYRRLVAWKDNGAFNVAAAQAFARTSIAAGQGAQGIESLTSYASQVTPDDAASYQLILASLYSSLGQDDKARTLTEQAIERAPSSPAPYLQQAGDFSRKKDYRSALSVLDRGIAAGAQKEALLLGQAQIQNADGRTDDAIATYRELLRLNPKSAVAANELANALADRNPLDKVALRDARDLLRKNATFKSLAIIDTLAWSDYRLGDFQRAKELLGRVKADQSPNPQLRFHYGAVLVALGDDSRGQKIIKATLNDSYPGRNEAQQMVKD